MSADDAPQIPGVDLGAVAAWMDELGLGHGSLDEVHQLTGGTQNILVGFSRAGARYVLRRPPLHPRARSNDVLRREARLLAALNDTEVPAPRFIAASTDEAVLGVVCYLMEAIDGVNLAGGLVEPYLGDLGARHEIGIAAVDGIAALARTDHVALGLADFGRPERFLERQVERWTTELLSYSELEGYPGPTIPHLEEVSGWLGANVPTSSTTGLMHGDFHLANLLFGTDRARLAAIVDWEMATVGDPLVDLGWLLATWPGPDGLPVGPAMAFNHLEGFATPAELIARYEEQTGLNVDAIDFYVVLACFKLGIILEGTHARTCAGRADHGVGDLLHAITVALFDKAATLL